MERKHYLENKQIRNTKDTKIKFKRIKIVTHILKLLLCQLQKHLITVLFIYCRINEGEETHLIRNRTQSLHIFYTVPSMSSTWQCENLRNDLENMRLSLLKYSARQMIRASLSLESFISSYTVRRYLGPVQHPYQQNTTLITWAINKCCSPQEMAP